MTRGGYDAQGLCFLGETVTLEADHLAQTDGRLFGRPFGLAEVAWLKTDVDVAQPVDAFVARFGRLQDTFAAGPLARVWMWASVGASGGAAR